VGPFIQARIDRYAANEIRFNLMAVIGDRQELMNKQIAALKARHRAIMKKLGQEEAEGAGEAGGAEAMEVDEETAAADLPEGPEELQAVLAETGAEVAR
jgi:ubiquitin carboxyl-terminal hydrolase L5